MIQHESWSDKAERLLMDHSAQGGFLEEMGFELGGSKN